MASWETWSAASEWCRTCVESASVHGRGLFVDGRQVSGQAVEGMENEGLGDVPADFCLRWARSEE